MKSWAGRAAEALMHGSVPGKHGGGGGGGVEAEGGVKETVCQPSVEERALPSISPLIQQALRRHTMSAN